MQVLRAQWGRKDGLEGELLWSNGAGNAEKVYRVQRDALKKTDTGHGVAEEDTSNNEKFMQTTKEKWRKRVADI